MQPNPEQQQQQRVIENLSQFIQIEQIVRACTSVEQLKFVMLNDTRRLVPYQQAIFWSMHLRRKCHIEGASGALQVDTNSPYLIWMREILLWVLEHKEPTIQIVTIPELPESLQQQAQLHPEWAKGNGVWVPLFNQERKLLGGLWLWRDSLPWQEPELKALEFITNAYAYSLSILSVREPFFARFKRLLSRKQKIALAVITAVTMVMPIRQSVLAPAEIVSANSSIVSAPMDGIIHKIFVSPNQVVETGTKLFTMDDTDLRNRYQTALKSLEVIQADYNRASNQSFTSGDARLEVIQLKPKLEEKQAEIKYLKELMERLTVKAEAPGVALFKGQDDWLGKPVVTGERIMVIANNNKIELTASIAVADIIDLPENSDVTVYLNIDPLNPVKAKLKHVNYEASLTSENTLAYRAAAIFSEYDLKQNNNLTLGLQGTAKIYGKKVTLFYYLFKRPISFIRQKLGM